MTVSREAPQTHKLLAPVLSEVQRVSGWLWQRGWAECGAGNLSIDVTEFVPPESAVETVDSGLGDRVMVEAPAGLSGRSLLVSAAGARFRELAQRPTAGLMLLRVRPDGGVVVEWDPSDGHARPTSELVSHLCVHAAVRTSGAAHRAVLHTHATDLLAFNHTRVGATGPSMTRALWSMLPEVKMLVPEGVGLVPYRSPGSEALARATAEAAHDHRVVVWDKHGCLCVEDGITEAFDLVDLVDKAARIYLRCAASGETPRGLSDDELSALGP